MDSILIILKKKKWPKGFICPYTGTIFYIIRIYSRSQVSVYRTIGPLVGFPTRRLIFWTWFKGLQNRFSYDSADLIHAIEINLMKNKGISVNTLRKLAHAIY